MTGRRIAGRSARRLLSSCRIVLGFGHADGVHSAQLVVKSENQGGRHVAGRLRRTARQTLRNRLYIVMTISNSKTLAWRYLPLVYPKYFVKMLTLR